MKKKKLVDDGRTLFDVSTPLTLPKYNIEELTNHDTFISDAKETSGLIMKINKSLINKIANGESPNHHLSNFLNEMTKSINSSVTSYYKLIELENQIQGSGNDNTISIDFTNIN